jgi:rubrerythrin
MALNTCSEGISYARGLEEASAGFYERLAQRFPDDAEAFRGYAAGNKKNVANVERAYFGVITDALEGCYAFNIEPEDYAIDVEVPEGLDRAGALAKAIAIEETLTRYYTDAAEQSKGLMADVPRAFTLVARKRGERIEELKAKAAR